MKSDITKLDELNRREFITSAAKACLGVGLLPMAGSYIHNNVQALTPGSRPAAARYVIYLNMTGAMSHLDTFGTNPDAPDIQGPTKSIPTSADGVILSENLPLTAKHTSAAGPACSAMFERLGALSGLAGSPATRAPAPQRAQVSISVQAH